MFLSLTLDRFNDYIMLWPVSGSIVKFIAFNTRFPIKGIGKIPALSIKYYNFDMSQIVVASIP
jgi:hypothetical protein